MQCPHRERVLTKINRLGPIKPLAGACKGNSTNADSPIGVAYTKFHTTTNPRGARTECNSKITGLIEHRNVLTIGTWSCILFGKSE